MKIKHLQPIFVDSFPDESEEGYIYVSIKFRTAKHLCCCGCGTEVVTPIRPTQWTLTYDGESVSLAPSIGNHSFPCQSHYWLRDGKIEKAFDWSELRSATAEKGSSADSKLSSSRCTLPQILRKIFLRNR